MAEHASRVGPARARERLRIHLRRLREQSGFSANTVAKDMYWSPSKLNRIETGAVTISPVEVRALLSYYGVRDEKDVAQLMGLADTSRRQRWWNTHKLTKDYQQYVAYEHEASRISEWHALFFPGLVQTEDYAKALVAAINGISLEHEDVTARVEVRMTRQRELFDRMDGPNPPRLIAAMDEAVLLRPVGGPDVMRAQLDHLLALSKRAHVELVIVPLSAGGHRGLGGTFELLEFENAEDPPVLFVESAGSDFTVKDREVTGIYLDTVADLKRVGQTKESAVAAIQEIREQLKN